MLVPNKLSSVLLMSMAILGSVAPNASAQESAAALAKAAQNPIASMISLPLQNNTTFNVGPEDKTLNVLNIQPVWPFSVGENWNVITRTILPVISQPGFGGQSRENGVGDINFTSFFSPKDSGKWTWGAGPTVVLPTASDDRLGNDNWQGGASFVALTMPGQWVVGGLVSNVWSLGGGGADDPDINQMVIQPFINYNFPDSGGWYFSTAPIITANWEADDSSDTWTVPLGGGFGKIFKVGKQPLNAQFQAFYNVVKPDNAGDWQMRLQLQFLFPK